MAFFAIQVYAFIFHLCTYPFFYLSIVKVIWLKPKPCKLGSRANLIPSNVNQESRWEIKNVFFFSHSLFGICFQNSIWIYDESDDTHRFMLFTHTKIMDEWISSMAIFKIICYILVKYIIQWCMIFSHNSVIIHHLSE